VESWERQRRARYTEGQLGGEFNESGAQAYAADDTAGVADLVQQMNAHGDVRGAQLDVQERLGQVGRAFASVPLLERRYEGAAVAEQAAERVLQRQSVGGKSVVQLHGVQRRLERDDRGDDVLDELPQAQLQRRLPIPVSAVAFDLHAARQCGRGAGRTKAELLELREGQ
jgi:hypothetical protein